MDAQVRTRWTPDGLVEITVDAATAQALLRVVTGEAGTRTMLGRLRDALTHTLHVPRGEESSHDKD